MLRVPYAELYEALHRAMLQLALKDDPNSRLFSETTHDGVYSHGP